MIHHMLDSTAVENCHSAAWQREYYDRLIPDADEYRNFVNYAVENPARAGLKHWEWVWRAEMGVEC
jgi:hypothetical protein